MTPGPVPPSAGPVGLPERFFLPGVPGAHVLGRLARAGGDEIGSGKLASPDSSAALAVNAFGWFNGRPEALPPLPGLEEIGPALRVEVEHCARLPWRGGRHPWLDALVETERARAGVESKRFEPFRDRKAVLFSDAYGRVDWGKGMAPYARMRDALLSGRERFDHLDAAQLVKHAFGLATDAKRAGKPASLLYLYAEPAALGGRPIRPADLARHRAEVARFAEAVDGAEVAFAAASYRDWLATWPQDGPVAAHRKALVDRFSP